MTLEQTRDRMALCIGYLSLNNAPCRITVADIRAVMPELSPGLVGKVMRRFCNGLNACLQPYRLVAVKDGLSPTGLLIQRGNPITEAPAA